MMGINFWQNTTITAAVFALITITACAPSVEANHLVKTEGIEGVIFSPAYLEQNFSPAGDPDEGFWMPSQEDVLVMEAGLPAYLIAQSEVMPERFYRQPPLWERLEEYNRQYMGISEDGQRAIYGNYFCYSPDNWQVKFVFVMDGGDCFFQVKYNPDTGEFYDLEVNGEA